MIKLLTIIGLGVLGYRTLKKWLVPPQPSALGQKKPGSHLNKADAVDADFVDIDE